MLNTAGVPRDATRARAGDFVQSLTGVQSRLYAYICSLLGEAAGARDVLQETNLALWDKAQEYDPDRPFVPWAYKVAYLQVLAYRKRCSRSRLLFDEQLVSELAEQAASRDDDLDQRLEALGDCMGRLPGPRREMIDLGTSAASRSTRSPSGSGRHRTSWPRTSTASARRCSTASSPGSWPVDRGPE
jgi:RNA polymerase sigma-70 factor (ECF subfamily)